MGKVLLVLKLFIGWDDREAVGGHAFIQSVLEKTTVPVQIVALHRNVFKNGQRDSTNAFGYSRFLIPHLCGYNGYALYLDGADMLLRADLEELWSQRESWFAIKVVKHDYKTKHPVKYLGTELEAQNLDYPRKNWSSLMLWDCGHYMNRKLTPEFIESQPGSYLHRLEWLPDNRVGELPVEWNWLDEYGENPEAKIVHWTTGIPGFYQYRDAPHASEWRDTVRKLTRGMG